MSAFDMVYASRRLRYLGRTLAATCGRGGVRDDKRERDGATPRGILRIAALMYRPDRIAPPAPWAVPIHPGDLWCDEPAHPSYNQLCRAPLQASHEQMRRADPQYDIVLITDWNWPNAHPGAGSAIFMHQWRRPGAPTAGCIALARPDIHWLATRAVPGTRLIVR
ncbi:L,D-transpeptidase family protein [Planktomarina temperata]|nr:L,D-transpeptidase family protein [Planktomarina temperata]